MWNSIHDGVLIGITEPTIPKDLQNFGVIHGDLNNTNIFIKDDGTLNVFDWDQSQKGWFLYDLAMPVWAVTMLVCAGFPMSGAKVDNLDLDRFTEWICDGYDPKTDREGLKQCVRVKRDFYERFCRRAQAEGELPADMKAFIDWTVSVYD
jgi:hypothetical protein